jgi:hypothetical protein
MTIRLQQRCELVRGSGAIVHLHQREGGLNRAGFAGGCLV